MARNKSDKKKKGNKAVDDEKPTGHSLFKHPTKRKSEEDITYHPKKHKYYYGSQPVISDERAEAKLLKKFENEVLANDRAIKTLSDLQSETKEKNLHSIKRYVRFCANKGLSDFYVTRRLAKEFIESRIIQKGQLSEDAIKRIQSALNKLYHMNKIVYSSHQPNELLEDDLITEIMSESQIADRSPSDTPSLERSIGKVSKHRLTEQEELLLKKFDQEILNSEKTRAVLESLSGNTFKSYSTDMKRFIKFCAQQGKSDFLLDENILSKFSSSEFKRKKDRSSATFRNLRSSLLKLHQLTSLVYDVKYSEGEIVYFINNVKEVPHEDTAEDKLLAKLQDMYKTTNLLSGLSETSKKLYSNEYNRYATFCAREGLDHFHLTGPLLKKFFVHDIIDRSPHISGKKLQEILSRLNRLHAVNVETIPNYPAEIKDLHIVKQFLKEYKKNEAKAELADMSSLTISSSSSDSEDTNVYGGKSGYSGSVPGFVMNRNISTVTQLVEEWQMVLKRTEKWGLEWIKTEVDHDLYSERKVIVDFIGELLQEMSGGKKTVDHVARVLDAYMVRKKISLHNLIQKIEKYPEYSKKEFLRILK
ncbi:uncharacterized protein SPAPADRAFT_49178 [Spathaspora passalidarum NRRL Y-27907]|uniref:Core-binding (CB) domain-containing protein n=1 Tax=Spathaspora passalidarum (strain NRRL Y-27907 / 11-Y1) TaxID=619300 RepID=G3AHE2_SPAPN|nr:uncharacterized protein SPAPADRAFT_49178 [Spathaspora passalidarum NRRL Y-27907]EGW34106.1 hypothetical protein SPAPADRAFT_49178 [Spathaspora passalidarum NRRL Y-27907]